MIIAGTYSSALTTFAGLGVALILEAQGARKVRLGWTDAMEPRLVVTAEDFDDEAIAAAVLDHARENAAEGGWIGQDLPGDPWKGRSAVFSPRIKSAASDAAWADLQAARHTGIDRLDTGLFSAASEDLIGALGEPAYWPVLVTAGHPDEGASRWEMKTRNRGEDFIRNRLRGLAGTVAKRTPETVRAGLVGTSVVDEAYKGKRSEESRTSTGLTTPRFTDSALAWCALWGISAFPVVHRIGKASVTAGALPLGKFTPQRMVLPIVLGPASMARWRTVLCSSQLHEVATAGTPGAPAATTWLVSHGVRAISSYPVSVSDNPSAPERAICECVSLDVLPD